MLTPNILLSDLTDLVIGYLSIDCDFNAYEEMIYYYSFLAKEELSTMEYHRWTIHSCQLLRRQIPQVHSYVQFVTYQYEPPLEEMRECTFTTVVSTAQCNRLKCYQYYQHPCAASCPFPLNLAWYQQRKERLRRQRKRRKILYR